MYTFYRSRHVLGWLPALAALVLIALYAQRTPLKVQPVYDESAVELALVEPDPVQAPEPGSRSTRWAMAIRSS